MRGKKLIGLPLVLMLFMSLAMVNVAPVNALTPTFEVLPANNVYNPGQSFTVSIAVKDVDFNVRGWGFKIKFNTDVFEFPPTITEGPYLKSGLHSTFFVTNPVMWAGYVAVSSVLTSGSAVTGNGTLALVTFNVKAPGLSDLMLLDSELIRFEDAAAIPVTVAGSYFSTTVPVASFDMWPKRYVYSAVHTATHISEFECMTPPTYPIPCPYGDDFNYSVVDLIQVYVPGIAGKNMTFDASASWSPVKGRNVTSYTWDFGDGTLPVTTTKPEIIHAFAQYRKDPYQVKLTVTDSAGESWTTLKPFLVWRDLTVADIWPSLVWFDTVDKEFFHGQINDGEIIYGTGEVMSYIEILLTIVNQGSLTEKMQVSVTAKCLETGREYSPLWFDWLPSPTGRYAMLRPGTGSGWNIDYYWYIAFPDLRDAGTYVITATVASADYSSTDVPVVSATGLDNDLSNNQMTLTLIVDAQADFAMKRIDNHHFSISESGNSLGLYGKATNVEKDGYNEVGTYARVAFSIISPEGVPVASPKTELVYLTNGQISDQLATSLTGLKPEMAGSYAAQAYVEFGPSPDKIIYTSLTVKPFSIRIVP